MMKTGSNPEIHLRFWKGFAEEIALRSSPLANLRLRTENSQKPTCWVICDLGEGVKLEAWWCIGKRAMRAQIPLMQSKAERRFDELLNSKAAIERDFGGELAWVDPRKNPKKAKKENKTYFVQTRDRECDPLDRAAWPSQHKWLAQNLRRLYDTFAGPDRLSVLLVDTH